ncbi:MULTISPECIES: hypothetical protein [unclassified Sphingomonas]|uniref:hypothetical protein n=1 Tax=unclassified Sphingomonas TaxID=196159 RepID=UPI00226A045D|nr:MULTISPECIES: hypothetical protein [unclassified Sphingomonas]
MELLTARREELSKLLLQYQRLKHRRVFHPFIERGSADLQDAARAMKLRCIRMGETFGGAHIRWAALHEDDWPIYRRDMLHTSELLIMHLEREHIAIELLLGLPDCLAAQTARCAPIAT